MQIAPKLTRSTLDLINNTYVVQNGMMYDYYPISIKDGEATGNYLQIDISPGVKAPGFVTYKKSMYEVPIRDLVRRRIDVRRVITKDNTREKAPRPAADKLPHIAREDGVQLNPEQLAASDLIGDEVSKAADMAWEDQVNALLTTLHTEEGEEFEIEVAP